jgi:hypothetical protein
MILAVHLTSDSFGNIELFHFVIKLLLYKKVRF